MTSCPRASHPTPWSPLRQPPRLPVPPGRRVVPRPGHLDAGMPTLAVEGPPSPLPLRTFYRLPEGSQNWFPLPLSALTVERAQVYVAPLLSAAGIVFSGRALRPLRAIGKLNPPLKASRDTSRKEGVEVGRSGCRKPRAWTSPVGRLAGRERRARSAAPAGLLGSRPIEARRRRSSPRGADPCDGNRDPRKNLRVRRGVCVIGGGV